MNVVIKHNVLPSAFSNFIKRRIILHHTVTPSIASAENALKKRGLSYHYIIGKDGTVCEYVPPSRRAFHAKGYNNGSIGIAFVCGGKYGVVNDAQINSCVSLMKDLSSKYRFLNKFTGHKHATKSGKIDPRFPGEPAQDVNWDIDMRYMSMIEDASGLRAELMKGKHANAG